MEKKHFIYSCIILFFIAIFSAIGTTLYISSKQLDESRRNVDQFREQLYRAEDTNRELTEQLEDSRRRIEQCTIILSELDGLTTTNVNTIREAISVIEELRVQVQRLEMELGYWSPDSYYDRVDSWLEAQGLEVPK